VLNGTALLYAELGVPADPAPVLEFEETVLEVSAFCGGTSVFAEGVNSGDPVSAFEPAEVEPLPADDEAGAPLRPAEEFASI
jgi:hypothetical protein